MNLTVSDHLRIWGQKGLILLEENLHNNVKQVHVWPKSLLFMNLVFDIQAKVLRPPVCPSPPEIWLNSVCTGSSGALCRCHS